MRILLVEDDTKISAFLKQGLVYEGFAVDVAQDGEDGLDFALTEDYDLIILDLMLPKLSGKDVCLQLRDKKNNVPILMLTALGTTEDKITGLSLGADDYLAKPFDFDELLARIRALLRRPKNYTDTKLQINDLVLNATTKEVSHKGKKIDLSKKEFSLLEYLMRNLGKTLSKEQLIQKVWDFDADVLPNTVEVYIGYLRNKIDKPFKTNLIKTVRGFGYKMEEK